MKKEDKRGSHVSFAISFMIFVSFIVFLYVILGPAAKIKSNEDLILNHLEETIIKNTSAELITISIKQHSEIGKDCLNVNLEDLEITKTNFLVKNSKGEIVNSEKDSNLRIRLNNEDFFKIYASDEEFNQGESLECGDLIDYSGKTGLIRTNNYVFETKMIELIGSYNEEYESLKEEFNIPKSQEFEFGFVYSNITEIKTERKNTPSNVYVELFPIKYVNKNANIEQGYLKIITW